MPQYRVVLLTLEESLSHVVLGEHRDVRLRREQLAFDCEGERALEDSELPINLCVRRARAADRPVSIEGRRLPLRDEPAHVGCRDRDHAPPAEERAQVEPDAPLHVVNRPLPVDLVIVDDVGGGGLEQQLAGLVRDMATIGDRALRVSLAARSRRP